MKKMRETQKTKPAHKYTITAFICMSNCVGAKFACSTQRDCSCCKIPRKRMTE